MKPLQYHYDSDATRQLCDRYGARLENLSRTRKLSAAAALIDRANDLENGEQPGEVPELPVGFEELDSEVIEFRNCIALAIGILNCI